MEFDREKLRDEIGQAIMDAIKGGAEDADYDNSTEIDRLADVVMKVISDQIDFIEAFKKWRMEGLGLPLNLTPSWSNLIDKWIVARRFFQ